MHRVILHISSSETKTQQRIFNQIANILSELPDTIIEVATHSDATTMVFKGAKFNEQIANVSNNQITFLACENSLKSHNMEASDLADGVKVVKSTLAHIIKRQTEGWLYIKIG